MHKIIDAQWYADEVIDYYFFSQKEIITEQVRNDDAIKNSSWYNNNN